MGKIFQVIFTILLVLVQFALIGNFIFEESQKIDANGLNYGSLVATFCKIAIQAIIIILLVGGNFGVYERLSKGRNIQVLGGIFLILALGILIL